MAGLLTARLVARPADVWDPPTVLPHACSLHQATAAALTDPAHTDAVTQLRDALINAGEVDIARIPAATD
ncbi:hypothetical protein ACIP10_35400 [Streptomyces galbus]|uniref:hypothetical protein n=1 Tax=Streptomyces galbus TaxID=33898 RepID=UPI0037F39595